MRIDFDDDSFIEFSKTDDKIAIILGARDGKNNLKKVINSAKVPAKQLSELLSDIQLKD